MSVWVFFRRLFVFCKLRSPRDSACKKRAHQNEIYREKKYYDKLSANLHLPGKTLHFSTQMYIILFGRVRNEVKENRAVRAYKIVYITV